MKDSLQCVESLRTPPSNFFGSFQHNGIVADDVVVYTILKVRMVINRVLPAVWHHDDIAMKLAISVQMLTVFGKVVIRDQLRDLLTHSKAADDVLLNTGGTPAYDENLIATLDHPSDI